MTPQSAEALRQEQLAENGKLDGSQLVDLHIPPSNCVQCGAITAKGGRLTLPEGEASALAHSLPSWPIFDDAHAAREEAKERGWKLAILSNTDRDLIDASMEVIAVGFDDSIVAGEIGSYKPASRHWEVFRERHGGVEHVHVAQSLFHDIGPTSDLGVSSA